MPRFSVFSRGIANAQVFTYSERTEPRFTVKQAYEHAAMVYRAIHDIPQNKQVYSSGTYNTFDDEVVLTAEQFSNAVDDILYGMDPGRGY